MIRTAFALVIAVGLFATTSRAADAPATSAPTSRPSASDATPVDGFKAYLAACAAGDSAGALKCCRLDPIPERAKFASLLVRTDVNVAAISRAAAKRYGAEAQTTVAHAFRCVTLGDLGESTPEGTDRANVHVQHSRLLIPMVNVGGHWIYDTKEMGDRLGMRWDRGTADVELRGSAAAELKPEVESGHFTSLNSLLTEIFRRTSPFRGR